MPDNVTNVTYTINGQTKPLTPGTRFEVGQVVTFAAVLAGGGNWTAFTRVGDRSKAAVAWEGRSWTVDASDLPVNRLRFNHRRNKVDQPDLLIDISVAAAPVATPVPTPVPTKPNTGTPAPATRLAGRMKVGLVDASAQSLALTRPLLEPLKLYSLAPWVDTGDFGRYQRDKDVAGVIELAAALGMTPLWRCAQAHLQASDAKARAVEWHLAHAADMIAATDASSLKGQPVRIQIGNEPDNDTEYWNNGEASYVRDYLVPVAAALRQAHGDRVFIVAAGWSWNISTLEALIDEIAPVVDAIAFHGYPTAVNDTAYNPIKRAVKLAHDRGLLLIRSEGNTGDGKRYKTLGAADRPGHLKFWASKIGTDLVMSEMLGVDEYLYFIAYDHQTTASPARLFDLVKKAGRVQALLPTPFYEAFKAVMPV